ncbi:MAG: hypothetical protein GY841_02735 [FCB group bacterium]|nr:hypothetical protein [FCB group bacterium]
MASLTAQQIASSGLSPVLSAVAASDTFANTGREFIEVANGSGGSINVTIATPKTVDGLDVDDRIVAVPAGESRLIGPFPVGTYSTGGVSGGIATVTCSVTTTVTIGVFTL